jgi:carbonic anhydrase
MIDAQEALQRLQAGNARFVSGRNARRDGVTNQMRREELASGQEPFAIILGCSDSRVPAEIVFDQGLGDLFVIRVAGNIVAPSQIGSIEFAADRFGTPLVVVLGHSGCGAVEATIEELGRPSPEQSPNLAAIVSRVSPAIVPLLEDSSRREDLLADGVRANIEQSVEQLRSGSLILAGLISDGRLRVVGAEYSLETGVVTFIDTSDLQSLPSTAC